MKSCATAMAISLTLLLGSCSPSPQQELREEEAALIETWLPRWLVRCADGYHYFAERLWAERVVDRIWVTWRPVSNADLLDGRRHGAVHCNRQRFPEASTWGECGVDFYNRGRNDVFFDFTMSRGDAGWSFVMGPGSTMPRPVRMADWTPQCERLPIEASVFDAS